MTTYEEYIDYFETTADDHIGISCFRVGGIEMMLGSQRADIEYPCLWLELPTVNFVYGEEGQSTIEFKGAFALIQGHEEDNELEQQNLHSLLEIVKDIIGKIRNEWEGNMRQIDPHQLTVEPIVSALNDNCTGWRVEFTTATLWQSCYNPSQFGVL